MRWNGGSASFAAGGVPHTQTFGLTDAMLETGITEADLRKSLLGRIPCGEPRGGIDIHAAEHDPDVRWYYFPEMTSDEVPIWKGFDSAEVPLQPTLHTSFDDRNGPEEAPERMSVEVRVLCLLPAAE
ncbi:MAG: hypothetical protein EP301_13270 [Gammaproteobacteria bacterium]|nr:MAG: hypothetical protein EP301_13270 [Gammaproteobacteria bacterium]